MTCDENNSILKTVKNFRCLPETIKYLSVNGSRMNSLNLLASASFAAATNTRQTINKMGNHSGNTDSRRMLSILQN